MVKYFLKNLLKNSPQKKGICKKLLIFTPKKPNSAMRKISKILLNNKINIFAYINGEGYCIQEHNFVLIKGDKRNDLIGVSFMVIRGALEAKGVKNRKTSRSKYGTKKIKIISLI